jgi:hypothetical protein
LTPSFGDEEKVEEEEEEEGVDSLESDLVENLASSHSRISRMCLVKNATNQQGDFQNSFDFKFPCFQCLALALRRHHDLANPSARAAYLPMFCGES